MDKKDYEDAEKWQKIFLSQFREIMEWSLADKYSNVMAREMLSWRESISGYLSRSGSTEMAKNMQGCVMNPLNYVKKIFTDFLLYNREFNMFYKADLKRPLVNFLLQVELRGFDFVSVNDHHRDIIWLYEKIGDCADAAVELGFENTVRGTALRAAMAGRINRANLVKYRKIWANPLAEFSETEGGKKYFYKKPLLADSELFEIDNDGDKYNLYLSL